LVIAIEYGEIEKEMIMERKRRSLFLEAHIVFFFLKGIVRVLSFVLTAPSRRKVCSSLEPSCDSPCTE
jgi:hypothetical protein